MGKYKVYIDSARWECGPNLVVCSRLYHFFKDNGHIIINNPEKADYIIINSCGVTDRGKNRTLNIVNNYVNQKSEITSIIVFGCLMDIEREVANGLDIISIGFKDSNRLSVKG